MASSKPYRPAAWSQKSTARVTLTAPTANQTDPTAPAQTTIYVFDAVIRAQDERRLVITENPVQTGAAITDNAYTLPARLTLDIMMSDAMDSYTPGQFTNTPSRSVSAWQLLKTLYSTITLCQVSTRLDQYSNMLIENMSAEESDQTFAAGIFTVTFREILVAADSSGSSTTAVSARPQTTNNVIAGQIPVLSVLASIFSQHNVLEAILIAEVIEAIALTLARSNGVPAAGHWSSSNVSGLVLQIL